MPEVLESAGKAVNNRFFSFKIKDWKVKSRKINDKFPEHFPKLFTCFF